MFADGHLHQAKEAVMGKMWRRIRTIVALIVACAAATVPACGSMGGGMKYLVDPPFEAAA